MPEEFHNFHSNSLNQFSILHLNIRSIKIFFENFKLFLNSINFTFSVICLSETWWDNLATIQYKNPYLNYPIIKATIKLGVIVKVG